MKFWIVAYHPFQLRRQSYNMVVIHTSFSLLTFAKKLRKDPQALSIEQEIINSSLKVLESSF